jgi:hypothetical protein
MSQQAPLESFNESLIGLSPMDIKFNSWEATVKVSAERQACIPVEPQLTLTKLHAATSLNRFLRDLMTLYGLSGLSMGSGGVTKIEVTFK